MRPERVTLKDQSDAAFFRRHVCAPGDGVDNVIADANLPAAGVLNAGNHPQDGGLAAAGWPQQAHKFAIFHRQVDVVDRRGIAARIGFAEIR